MSALKPAQALAMLHSIAAALTGPDKPGPRADFTLRQLLLLLIVYMQPPPHTVRGLAARIGVTKPVITRALDALGKLGLLSRRRDPADGRNVIVQRTVKGALYVERLGDMVADRVRAA